MKLLTKFNLVFILVYGCGLAVAAYLSHQFLQKDARDQVMRQAELMMQTSLASRNYTNVQIKPLLEENSRTRVFLAQTVPAFAATEMFSYLRKRYPAYTYKEATLNPTNLRDRAVDWEADVINIFRNNRQRTDFSGERDTPDGPSLFVARPIIPDQSCLECHSVPARAPKVMLKAYGTANGFGWKANDVVGAQIVSVPMSLPISIADRAFRTLLIYLGVIGLGTLIILDMALVFVVIRPVVRLSHAADEISKGNLDVPELPAAGKDEISTLARSFNRMYVSLRKAIQLLDNPNS
jgi:HAMP domain-containing protein